MGLSGRHARSGTRLEAFSDGVIAVILTIMVLELHVPHLDGIAGLWQVAPRLGIYGLSFLMVAIYWVNHHELCRRVETIDYRTLWANLLWLFVLSLIPFFTDYVGEKHFDSFSVATYDVVMLAAGLAFWVLRIAINNRQRHDGTFTKADSSENVKHIASMALYVLAIPVAYVRPFLSLMMNLAVTLIWILPELGTRERSLPEHPSAEPPIHTSSR